MRVPGYCTKCHKIKTVQASGTALALSAGRGGVVQGVCSSCAEAAEQKKRDSKNTTPRRFS